MKVSTLVKAKVFIISFLDFNFEYCSGQIASSLSNLLMCETLFLVALLATKIQLFLENYHLFLSMALCQNVEII